MVHKLHAHGQARFRDTIQGHVLLELLFQISLDQIRLWTHSSSSSCCTILTEYKHSHVVMDELFV